MNRLKELRKRANMQQKELAIALGVAQPTVSEWENQKSDPKKDKLARICELFNCHPSDVIIPDYFDPHQGLLGYTWAQPTDTMYVQERIRRNPDMQELFDAADTATTERIRAATETLKGNSDPDAPKTFEAQLISSGIDRMSPDDRKRALTIMQQVFPQYIFAE